MYATKGLRIMAKKLIFVSFVDKTSGAYAKVFSPEPFCDEWVVKVYNHLGQHMDASDYFTNDRDDAIGTASVVDCY